MNIYMVVDLQRTKVQLPTPQDAMQINPPVQAFPTHASGLPSSSIKSLLPSHLDTLLPFHIIPSLPKINPRLPKRMFTHLKRHQNHRPPPRHKPLNHLRLRILQRAPKDQTRIGREQLLEVFPFSAGAEQECSRREEGEGCWVGDWCYV